LKNHFLQNISLLSDATLSGWTKFFALFNVLLSTRVSMRTNRCVRVCSYQNLSNKKTIHVHGACGGAQKNIINPFVKRKRAKRVFPIKICLIILAGWAVYGNNNIAKAAVAAARRHILY
jgi:hypothetical protein